MRKRAICFYFQVHQPFRLRTYRFFDIGHKHDYFDEYANKSIMRKVAEKCYLPTNSILLQLIKEYGAAFKVSFSISGSALDQFEMYAPDVLESFRKLAQTGQVEFLAETNAHSLCALINKEEFVQQVNTHAQRIEKLFAYKPKTFRNTELIYSDNIGEMVLDMGYKGLITEGAKHILGWKSPNYLYCSIKNPKLKILLKNFRLSDDIAFRFSNQTWNEWPLTAKKFTSWLKETDAENETVNLFMDYETFGEHQWAETGIFDFLKALPKQILSETNFVFKTPCELIKDLQPVAPISVPYPVSWADEERDLTAWLGNELQNEAFSQLYALYEKVKNCTDPSIQRDWLRLQNSDHLYYMCTKWFSDGEVHKYFNPYQGPYEAFINYMNVLSDFSIRVNECSESTNSTEIILPQISAPEPQNNHKKAKTQVEKKATKKTDKKLKENKKDKNTKSEAETIKFNDIILQPAFILKDLVKNTDVFTLVHALKIAGEDVKDAFLSYLGIRKLKIYEEELIKSTELNTALTNKAQNTILEMFYVLKKRNKKAQVKK